MEIRGLASRDQRERWILNSYHTDLGTGAVICRGPLEIAGRLDAKPICNFR